MSLAALESRLLGLSDLEISDDLGKTKRNEY